MKNSKARKNIFVVIKVIILSFLSLIFLMPVYYLVINSFKPLSEIMLSFVNLPKAFTLENYIGAWGKIDYLRIFGNTLFLTVGAVVITVLFASFAGYKLQRTHGRVSNFIFIFLAVGLLVPFTVIMVPMSQLFGRLGINNNLPVLIFVYAAIYMPMMIYVYRGYCKTIPVELDEAAKIDGCNQFQTFVMIILPLSKTILVSMAVLAAVWTWNDLVVALIAIDDSNLMTITRRVNNFIGFQSGTQWDFFTAAVSLSMVPIMILYAFLQKYIQNSVTSGAIKG